MAQDPMVIMAGVFVTLAFFALIAYVVFVLRASSRLVLVISSLAVLVGALPGVLYALHG